jgi:uncharacterized protein DUF6627
MFRRLIASLLIVSLIAPLPVHAGMVSTQKMLDQERIMKVVERAEVRAQLQAYGVDPAQLKARVAALTDEEAAELAARIDSLPAGGIDILGAILLVFLVLLLTDILGYTKVFPFTKPIKK